MRRFVALALSSTLVLQAAPLMAATARAGAQAPVATGALNGTAQSAGGQMLTNTTVQLRNLQTGQLAGTTTSNAAGGFSFTGLNPGNYLVEFINQSGAIVGSSASTAVAAGTTTTVTVSTMAAAAVAGAAAGGAAAATGISTAVVVTTVAVAAGIAGVLVVARDNASPSR